MSLKRSIKTVAVSGLCLTMMTIPASGMPLASDNGRPVSWVDNSRDTYERQTLMVDGKPFFFNGVQIRIDKVKDFYHYSDEQIQNLFQIARDDGCTAAVDGHSAGSILRCIRDNLYTKRRVCGSEFFRRKINAVRLFGYSR